jgi:signal peptidase I
VILVFTFILRVANVDGESMLPTLRKGDRLIISHIGYAPSNGDIVIVDSRGLDKVIVKRVIATGGQQIDINPVTGTVSVNGAVLNEDYINELTFSGGAHNYPVTVPPGHVFVMGDNRMNSTDSRSSDVWFVQEEDVLGKVIFRIFPFNALGNPAA